jgi:hypothetical protein
MKRLLITLATGLFAATSLSSCDRLSLDPTRRNISELLDGGKIEEVSPTVTKTIDGHPYHLAKATVWTKNGFGMTIKTTMGYVEDSDGGYSYLIDLRTFEHFIQTGDKTGFPSTKPLSVEN